MVPSLHLFLYSREIGFGIILDMSEDTIPADKNIRQILIKREQKGKWT
jgi:hypothetical protein